MNATLGWVLAALALAAGYVGYGWPGGVLALTVIAFWLLLQFSRAMRALRDAAKRPLGGIDSAVMLHSRVQRGMRLVDVLKLTRSLGHKLADEPETFGWRDGGGIELQVELRDGRVSDVRLIRPVPPETA